MRERRPIHRMMKDFDSKWIAFYDGLKTNENLPIHFYYVYILRRTAFILIVFYWEDLMAFQLMFNIFLSEMMIMFVGHCRMFKDP